ncbi:hypothetical protein G5B31_15710 [Rhodobacter sp. SGA-6-6]|uniref:hypothetical protein n=1 Tax=Rhodobacter sp. SGA-6-6 TaxID=2710882 RepID=UPI0013EC2685|nr:hypothetical protein [Rhodobacter sp. SGA-6-6]NGM46983.1 hypothetical protein [Rhodobacter sp. SGA-6-6]
MDKRKKSLMRGGAVILVALAAGHLVQTMNAEKVAAAAAKPKGIEQVSAGPEAAAPAPEAAALPAAEPAPALVATEPEAPPAPEAPVLAALPEVPPVAPEPALPAAPALDPAPEAAPPAPAAAAEDCASAVTLTAGPQAMISVAIAAPCRAGERVVLRHAGLALAEELGADGSLHLDLPALQTSGEVSVLFADAEVLRDAVPVPDAAAVHRFAVQWMADDAFQLHAFENGADYGQPGEVWSAAPVSPNGGYLVSLGNPGLDLPMLAEVYTFPAETPADLSIEATVTETTCGRELLGEVLEAQQGKVTVTDLTLAMPDCEALGDILVLKNPGRDVTLATMN